MDIILVRHGETKDNVEKIFSTEDTKLTEVGKEQIRKAKSFVDTLTFNKVYVSPFYRAIQTMEILNLNGIVEERIKEIDFGLFGGYTYEGIKTKFPEESKGWDGDYINYVTPKGESIKIAYERITSFLEEISMEDENVVLVCHGGAIRIALSWVFDDLKHFFKFEVDNGSINIITIDENRFKYIKKTNYTVE